METNNSISAKLEQLKLCEQILQHVPTTKEALLKRCQIYLTLRMNTKALVTSDSILQTDPTDLRAMGYKAKALSGLGRYQDSISFLIKAIRSLKGSTVNTNPNYIHKDRHLKILENHLKEAKHLLDQQTNGTYDMTLFVPNRKVKFDNVAEFKGPIDIGTSIPGKGRGVIATQDIQPGQLLLASRAFEIVFDDDDDDDWNLEMAIAQRLTLDPELSTVVYQLHAGKDLGYMEVKGTGIESSENSDQVTLQNNPVDLERITGICNMNSFGNSQNMSGYGHDSRGLWVLPSYINHDCIDFNCIWKCLGDFLFVRSVQEIKAGEEILISYTDSAEPLAERVKFFEAHDFLCQCRLCRFEMKMDEDPMVRNRRAEILKSVDEMSSSIFSSTLPSQLKLADVGDSVKHLPGTIVVLEGYLQELEEMGMKSGRPDWNFGLHLVLDILTKLYFQIGDEKYKDMAVRYYEVVNGAGACLEVGAAGQVVTYFLRSGDLSGALKWINLLKKDLSLVYGGSDVLKLIYPVLYAEAVNAGIEC